MNEVKILSTDKCDEAYGKTLVQYQAGDVVSFIFSDVNLLDDPQGEEKILKQIKQEISGIDKLPLWLDLSDDLRDIVMESEFDMLFIEYHDEDWSDDKADRIYEEAENLSFGSTIARGEDDCYLTVYAGAMGKVNWAGHPYIGEPCLVNAYIEAEKVKELMERDDIFEYCDAYGDKYYISFHMDMYDSNSNLYLGMLYYDPVLKGMDFYGDVTVNTISMPYLYGTVDTNNNSRNIEQFLIDAGIGKATGKYVQSGFCRFPVFKFSEEFLEKMMPEQMREYKKAYGKLQPLDKRIENIKSEGWRVDHDNGRISTGSKESDKELSSGRIQGRSGRD